MRNLSLNQPHAIVMVGIPGSGKTFFAEKFTAMFQAPYIDYHKITALANDSDAAIVLMNYQLDELLKTRQSIVIDGNTDTRTSRLDLAKKARKAGYEVLFIWVQTDTATSKARAAKQSKNQAAPAFSEDEYDRKIKRFTAPATIEKPVVISGKHTYASQAKVVLQRLSAPRAEISAHRTPPTRLEQSARRNITVR